MRSVDWIDGTLQFIDQTRLPREEITIQARDPEVVAEAIRGLRIRGAPAIGVAAAFAVVLAVDRPGASSPDEVRSAVERAVALLGGTRPTAVNLFAALARMRGVIESAVGDSSSGLREKLLREALAIQQEDIDACARIGALGSTLIDPGSVLLTHCNAGMLATAGEGTALSIITTAAAAGNVESVYVDETRPLLQGSRLTAWELVKRRIKTIVITDNAAGRLFQEKKLHAVVVGADRIAANGDTANKIGTYPLAVLASRHGVPFYVAAPASTFDRGSPTGESIRIEERREEEVTHIAGQRVAADGVGVFNPAFDVTPNNLITAIVTEKGILRPPFQKSIAAAIDKPGSATHR